MLWLVISWVTTTYIVISCYQPFGGTYSLHLRSVAKKTVDIFNTLVTT
jgi:hypothetical protein